MNIVVFVAVFLSIPLQTTQQSFVEGNYTRVIHVNKKGTDEPKCLEGNVSQGHDQQVEKSCRTIEYVSKNIGRGFQHIEIVLETSLQISGAVRFKKGNKLSLYGTSRRTMSCKCNKKSVADGRGFSFVHIHEIYISNISFVTCCASLNKDLNASLVFQASSDITIENVAIKENRKNSALMLIDCSGAVSIMNSTFVANKYPKQNVAPFNTTFAAGIHMHFSGKNGPASVSILNCLFEKNTSPEYKLLDPGAADGQLNLNGYGLGGALGIVFTNNSRGTIVEVENCTFVNNTGNHGGGVCVHLQDQASNITVIFRNSFFVNNTAVVSGGGIKLSLAQTISDDRRNYNIEIINVTFERNYGVFGGGLSIAALLSDSRSLPGELIRIIDCSWKGNFGLYSPAVDLSPFRFQHSRLIEGFLPIPLIRNCHVLDNYIVAIRKAVLLDHITQGVFVITRFVVHFQGSHEFRNNTHSAIYLTSGRAVFEQHSMVEFNNNTGLKGGAISANGFSTIVVNDNSQFLFFNNSAASVGGAIYYAASDQREYFEGRSCFLEYAGNELNLTKRNLSLVFTANQATRGSAIYTASLFSCYYAYIGRFNDNIVELLDTIGNFTFDVSLERALTTGIRYINFDGNSVQSVIPGQSLLLPLGMTDEFKSYVKSGYSVRVSGSDRNKVDVRLSNYFTINNKTRVFGVPNRSVELILSTPQELYNNQDIIKVNILSCPPGFYFEEIKNECRCSSEAPKHSYPAIHKCDHEAFRALVYYGFWAGYHPENTTDLLYTALFPFTQNIYGKSLLMPNNSYDLIRYVCGDTRNGALCGKCKQGRSTFYHSKQFLCGKNTHCKFGILFYCFSDLVPLAIFFTVVMTFGISLSSGNLNGFVFFCQVLDLFSIEDTFRASTNSSKIVKILHNGYQLIYGIFNLEFFSIFPFCLWEGATVMDILVFKYVTILFALVLIVFIILVANYSTVRMKRLRWMKRKVLLKSSMIHGISTLLIVSYSQCTRASLLILTTVYLRSKPGIEPIQVTYYGGLPYLKGKHLLYAIPAITAFFTIVILPPLVLVFYPSILHLLSLFNLSEHKLVHKLLTFSQLTRLMPLFDSLQGCYRDKLRFFSGLYFLYRVAILLAFTFSELTFYIAAQFLLLTILGIHSLAQPYKVRQHNIIDGLIFLNLAIINGIAIILKLSLISEFAHTIKNNTISIVSIRVLFAYLPIIFFLLFGLKKIVAKGISKYGSLRPNKRSVSEEQESQNNEFTDISHTSIELTNPLLH